MRPLRPLDVLDQYHENKIDRATAINGISFSSTSPIIFLASINFAEYSLMGIKYTYSRRLSVICLNSLLLSLVFFYKIFLILLKFK